MGFVPNFSLFVMLSLSKIQICGLLFLLTRSGAPRLWLGYGDGLKIASNCT